ncbi:PEP-CTERM sorting domain-containing protein [Duganella sp. Dugasp56]|uniref:PEP-CTERM sorting domain-containing protein n=1 Tax=Duganella sp. Dugasp56 TaxID=3243046 RepID=UPI0039AFD478
MKFSYFAAALAASLTLTLAPAAQAGDFGANLIVNGDAEAGTGSSNGGLVTVPGWSTESNFTVVKYGASGGFPSAVDPGPANRGLNFFAGGENNSSSRATQTIDLSALSAEINTGASRYDLSGWVGGYESQNDHATLTAYFYSGTTYVGFGSPSGGSTSDRGYHTGLLLLDAQDFIPVNTTSVVIALDMTRVSGSYNDGYADNLSFRVAPAAVPEADAYAMLLGGLALLGVVAKRKQRKA